MRNVEQARPGGGHLHFDVHRRDVAVGRQRDLRLRDQVPVVLDHQRDLRAAESALPHEDIRHERASLEHAARRFHAAHFDVAGEPLRSDSDREDRDLLRAQREQFVGDGRARVVGAVGQDDEAGERHHLQFAPRRLERGAEVGLVRVEAQSGRAVDAFGGRAEVEELHLKAGAQRREQGAGRARDGIADPVRALRGRRGRRSACCASRRSARRRSSAAARPRSAAASAAGGRRASTTSVAIRRPRSTQRSRAELLPRTRT